MRVRICLSTNQKAAPTEIVQSYLDGLWPHLQARQNGLQNVPESTVPCPVLIFEDFGTTGLGGDPHQWHKIEGTKNGFFTFFRAEGQSDKEKGDRGRWGVGKFVFPRSSQISTFWGITIRHEDSKQLLMGRSILKSHAIDGGRYVPDGYFGKQVKDNEDGELIVPFDEKEVVEKFCQDFGLARGTEPGLSLMVPWYDSEITQNTLLRAVIEDYFFPILGNDLEVSVESSEGKVDFTASTVVSVVERLNGNLASGMVPLINLAKWSKSLKPEDILQLSRMPETGAPKWNPALFPDASAVTLREKYHKGEKISVRVPFPVRPKGQPVKWSHFDVVFERDGTEVRERPVYVREGIIVSDIRSPYSRGLRSLVIADDGPLATLLGDSENPAHTQWQRDGSNYKGKYSYPAENLSFVINSVSEIIRFITEVDKEAHKTILIDVFSLPTEPDDPDAINTKVKKGQGNLPGKKTPPVVNPPPPQPKRFRVEKVQGGFLVQPGDPEAPMPKRLVIRVAYVIRSGNPLNKYDPADFELDKGPIAVEHKGMDLTFGASDKKQGNEIQAQVTDKDFLLKVTGFDENRDLFVKVTVPQEETDGDQAA